MTRTGKIARLPLAIRNELGHRLHNGELGTSLVDWLNTLPEVNAILTKHFAARPITEQNLSEWKQGGYLEWLRHQDALEGARVMREQAAEFTQAAGASAEPGDRTALLEDTTTLLVVALSRQLQELMARPPGSSQDSRDLLALAHELSRLRRIDQRGAMVKLNQDKRADELRRERELRARNEERQRRYDAEKEADRAKAQLNTRFEVLSEIVQRLHLARQNELRAQAAAQSATTSTQGNPTESDQIQPTLIPTEATHTMTAP